MSHSTDNHLATRKYFQSGAITLSYLDYGGESQNVLVFEQCGHGVHSDDPEGYERVVKTFLDQVIV